MTRVRIMILGDFFEHSLCPFRAFPQHSRSNYAHNQIKRRVCYLFTHQLSDISHLARVVIALTLCIQCIITAYRSARRIEPDFFP